MFVYKFNIMESLKEAGYSSTRLRREKLIGEAAMTDIRKGKMVGLSTLHTICKLLDMQPGNIIKYVPDEE